MKTFEFRCEIIETDPDRHLVSTKNKIFVDGKQVGCIDEIIIQTRKDSTIPKIIVWLPDVREPGHTDLKNAISRNYELLNSFPFVDVIKSPVTEKK